MDFYLNSNNQDEETLWLESISKNPAFNFLVGASEDLYSLHDGEPLNDVVENSSDIFSV